VKLLVEISRSSGKTLVMNLHSVELALAYFPRIIGFRGGRVEFDRPPTDVNEEMLSRLYAGISRSEAEEAGIPAPHDSALICYGPLFPRK
jgi:phosphonate transport system ATP-binding protein